MTSPAHTNNEAERLATLRSYGVLDTPAEKDFDDLVALAAQICGTPIAQITFVDETRQWIKATFGLAATETPRDFSICAQAIRQDKLFLVPDTMRDERFTHSPLVTGEPNIRFYAGSPLIAPDGQALGTLCVIDRQARQLDNAQQQALAVLSRHVMAQLELRRQARKTSRANNALLGILEDAQMAEKAVQESRALYHSLVEQMPAGIFRKDAEGRFVFVNSWFCKFSQTLPEHYLGLTPMESAQVIAKYKATTLDAKNATELALRGADHHAAILRTGQQIELEESRTLVDGRVQYFHVTKSAVFNAEGKVIGSQGILIDITARKHAEEATRHSNERFQVMARATNDAVWDWDLTTNALWWNDGFHTLFHFSPEEVEPDIQSWITRLHPDDLERVKTGIYLMIEKGQANWSDEYRFRRRDGSYADIFDRGFILRDPQGKAVRMIGAMMDITERKRAEIRIRQLNRVYAVLSDINQTIVREKDSQTMLAAACQIAVVKGKFRMACIAIREAGAKDIKFTSFGADEATLGLLRKLGSEGQVENGCHFTHYAMQTGQHGVCNDIANDPLAAGWREAALARNYRAMASFPLRNGETVVGTFNLYVDEADFFDADEVRLLDELAADISFALEVHEREAARKRTAEELRWRTVLAEAVMNSTLDGILVVDKEGKKLIQNQRMSDIWKIPNEFASDPDDTRQLDFVVNQVKNPAQFAEKVEHLYAHPAEVSIDEIELKNGKFFDRYSSPVCDQDGKCYGRIWVFRDVTERRQFEVQQRQSQKMEAMGQLAGGVAHDFNNILAVIQMQTDLLKFSDGVSSEQAELADEISASAQRAAALTRQLLLFSRREVFQPRDLDLSEAITNMTKMLQRTLGENIRMEFKFAAQPLYIHADAGMMDQILMNLAVNSRDAMPKGGLLAIETSAVEMDEFSAAQSANARPGSFVCLSVSDTGEGIPPEIMPRIFEPFFTTKDVGKGTGLGLATLFGIVQQHKGWVGVYSEVGRGTIFRIYLPRLVDRAPKKDAPAMPVASSGGKETILLVEDDSSLRIAVGRALSQLGYRVLEAPTAMSALKVWQEHQQQISLLMTDLVMPDGMNGRELAEKLLAENPRLKVIYTSGYSAEVVGHDFPLQEGVNFLTKPFEAHKLAQIIRARLNS